MHSPTVSVAPIGSFIVIGNDVLHLTYQSEIVNRVGLSVVLVEEPVGEELDVLFACRFHGNFP